LLAEPANLLFPQSLNTLNDHYAQTDLTLAFCLKLARERAKCQPCCSGPEVMSESISPEDLRALCDRIVKSGELGRSKTYAAILEYLASCAIGGTNPKEVAIAMDVLGREADFDVGKDSIVRVHVYHLRNKLSAYYARGGATEKWRID